MYQRILAIALGVKNVKLMQSIKQGASFKWN